MDQVVDALQVGVGQFEMCQDHVSPGRRVHLPELRPDAQDIITDIAQRARSHSMARCGSGAYPIVRRQQARSTLSRASVPRAVLIFLAHPSNK
jgi:hypothetical protein